MKVLVIGSGGREHAIAAVFKRSPKVTELVVAPGNAGIAKEFSTIPLYTLQQQLDYCESKRPDLVFIGPEQPLEQGLADRLEEMGIPCVGPSQAAARIETSKIFAKDLMRRYGIPTAAFFHTFDPQEALEYLETTCPYPAVIKADGLAAGKGVIIVNDLMEALEALSVLMGDSTANSHKGVVIEEFLLGWEVSLFAISDSVDFVTTLFSQDHKQLLDNDLGPNTGGMGAYAPVPEAEAWRSEIESTIIAPVLAAMRAEGCPFKGILYCGLMITTDGPKVIEFNCRFGDPEAQALLPLLRSDFTDLCQALVNGHICGLGLEWSADTCLAVVMASGGYPGSFTKGHPIHIDKEISSTVFYAGVAEENGQMVTNGGRVLCVSAIGADKQSARAKAYADIANIRFTNSCFRTDVAMRNNIL